MAEEMLDKAISRDGTAVAWWRSGSGPPLVLVHGTSADHTRWAPVRPLLEPAATLCALDRRGRGESGDAEGYDVAREVEDVVAVVDTVSQQHAGPVDLLGHSYGALCALEAALHTGNVRTLVLYEPPVAGMGDVDVAPLVRHLEDLLASGRRDELVATFFQQVVGLTDEQLEAFRSLPVWPRRVAAAHTLPRELRTAADYRFDPARFRSLDVPTLLLLGGDSPEFLQRATRQTAAALPRARVEVLAGQQHVAMDTAPQLFSDTVLRFLRDG